MRRRVVMDIIIRRVDGVAEAVRDRAGKCGALFAVRGDHVTQPLRGDSTASDAIHGVPYNIYLVIITIALQAVEATALVAHSADLHRYATPAPLATDCPALEPVYVSYSQQM